MNRVVSIACGLLLGISTPPAFAAEFLHTAYIKRIHPTADGSVRLYFVTEHASCTNGEAPKAYYITVGQNSVTADGLKAMHATVAVRTTT